MPGLHGLGAWVLKYFIGDAVLVNQPPFFAYMILDPLSSLELFINL
jgi:hypothetical protein